ncbi:multivesicular body subunit 12A [Carcharodon carcharias]|uniref:multivesicular body subunit 12A n=1 Tax=Carcharodon carcharias TaxID=13397 RepID=UPI001B7E963C|nr:multivesicular body subunit 12A [Carcharodon carcharias]
MAAPEISDPNCYPLTGVGWASNQSTCPKEYQLINATADGSSANFAKGFGQKSSCYLCVSSLLNKENPQGDIVSDIQLLPDKNPLPSGYAFISEFLDPKVNVSKKKRLCIKRVPFSEADTAVFDVTLTGKSKQIVPSYTCIGELSGFVIWCKKGKVAKPKLLPKPRNISVDMRALSLENESSRKVEELDVPLVRLSKRRSNLEAKDAVYSAENIYGISAMDGVPFVLHPRFESTVNVPSANITNFQIKSHAEIENQYNYSFMTEKTAAARLPPTAS